MCNQGSSCCWWIIIAIIILFLLCGNCGSWGCGCGIYENWEVNAGQWTLIIVEVDPPMR